MKKQIVKLNENQLHRIVEDSVKKVLNEIKVIGKIDDFDQKNAYGERFPLVPLSKEPDRNIEKYQQDLARKLRTPLRITKPKEYKEIFDELKDYIDEFRSDLKRDYDEFCDEIYRTCRTFEANGRIWYAEGDDNNAHSLPTMYKYCIERIKGGA